MINQAFAGITQDQAVLAFDRRQRGTFRKTFEQYVATRVGPGRINMGRQMLKRHGSLLSRVEQKFGVPPEIIVAIWGLESDFGKGDVGKMPVVRTLVTMAHDCRRTELFQGELLAALKIVQRGDLPLSDMVGAFAGEIGQTQFLPSSYIKYGVDFDGNGHVDLRHSVPDVLASTANLLHVSGFKNGAPYERRHAEFRSHARVEQGDGLSQDHRLFCRSAGGAVSRSTSRPGDSRERSYARGGWRLSRTVDGFASQSPRDYGSCLRGTTPGQDWARRAHPPHFPACPAIFSIRRCSTAPIGRRPEPLQQVHEPRIAADQNPRLVFLDAGNDALRGRRRRLVFAIASKRSIDCARRALSVTPTPVRALRTMLVSDAAGMHHREPAPGCSPSPAHAAGFRKSRAPQTLPRNTRSGRAGR